MLLPRDSTYLNAPEAAERACERCKDEHKVGGGTCEDREHACCDEFPPPRPIGEMLYAETDGWYERHHAQYDAERLDDCSCRCHWTADDYADEAAERAFDAERGN